MFDNDNKLGTLRNAPRDANGIFVLTDFDKRGKIGICDELGAMFSTSLSSSDVAESLCNRNHKIRINILNESHVLVDKIYFLIITINTIKYNETNNYLFAFETPYWIFAFSIV